MHRPWIRMIVLGVLAAAITPALCGAVPPSDLAFVERTGASFVSVRPTGLLETPPAKALTPRLRRELDRAVKGAENYLGVPAAAMERATGVLLPGGDEPPMVVRTVQPYDREAVLGKVLRPKYTETKYRSRALFGGGRRPGLCVAVVDSRVFVVGPEKQVRRLIDLAEAPHADHELAQGVAWAAEKHHLVAAIKPEVVVLLFGRHPAEMPAKTGIPAGSSAAPPENRPQPEPPPPPKEPGQAEESEDDPVRQADEPKLNTLLAEMSWEAWPYKPLFLASAVVAAVDLGDESKLHCRLLFADEAAAHDGEMSLRVVLYVVREWLGQLPRELGMEPGDAAKLAPAIKAAQAAVQAAEVQRSGRVVEGSLALKTGPADLGRFLAQAEKAAERVEAQNNLRQIGLAMQNYLNTYNAFPGTAICDKDGKPLLSWRVAILPFIEQAPLYNMFKLDEPWDSPNNKKLLGYMPRVYALPEREAGGKKGTYFRVFTGPMTPFDLAQTRGGPISLGLGINQFTDGTSNTLLVVEAAESVPWTKPEELPFDPKKPLPKLGGTSPGIFFALFADGSVHRISTKIPKDMLQALITPAGGEAIDWSPYESASGASRPSTLSGKEELAVPPPPDQRPAVVNPAPAPAPPVPPRP